MQINDTLLRELLERVDKIVESNAHITDAIKTIKDMADKLSDEAIASVINDDVIEKFMDGISCVVSQREETNRQALRFIERIYTEISKK
jgi:hypothetical protein